MSAVRRGFCPGIAEPLQTGDGLLARLTPSAAIPIHDFMALCEASQRDGSGIIEVTQRGNIQIRGLTLCSASRFARSVESLGLGDESKPTLLQPPLLGLDATETVELRPMLAQLRMTLANRLHLPALGPKVSVLLDGDGELHLDAVPADIRLRATSPDHLHVAIGGSAHDSVSLGWIKADQVFALVDGILAGIAGRGREARARNLAGGVITEFQARLEQRAAPALRPPAEPIAQHPLKSGRVALGIALAFGHTTVATLQRVVHAAASSGVTHIQSAPGRALIFVDLSPSGAHELSALAASEGFIVATNDSRRYVFACAGSPACRSATFSTRDLAPAVARVAQEWLNHATTVHLSGCNKGCAHPTAATLTFAGPDRWILDGRAGDPSHATLSSRELLAGLERLSSNLLLEQADLARLGTARIIECLVGANHHA